MSPLAIWISFVLCIPAVVIFSILCYVYGFHNTVAFIFKRKDRNPHIVKADDKYYIRKFSTDHLVYEYLDRNDDYWWGAPSIFNGYSVKSLLDYAAFNTLEEAQRHLKDLAESKRILCTKTGKNWIKNNARID